MTTFQCPQPTEDMADLRDILDAVDRWEQYAQRAVDFAHDGWRERIGTYAVCAAHALVDDAVEVTVDPTFGDDFIRVDVTIDREPGFVWFLDWR